MNVQVEQINAELLNRSTGYQTVVGGDKITEDSYTFRGLNASLLWVFGGTPRHLSTEVILDSW